MHEECVTDLGTERTGTKLWIIRPNMSGPPDKSRIEEASVACDV